MIDFHSHVLPGIDDGSRDTDMSLAMLRMEQEQNVQAVVATPHFYAEQDSVKGFLKRRSHSMERLMRAAAYEGLAFMPIHSGAEVAYFRHIGEAAMIPQLCIQDSRVLLLELPFCQWESFVYEDIAELLRKQELTVVLAHVERYYRFQKDKVIWNAVMELPVYCQMNAGPFLDWRERKRSLDILKTQRCVLLGSDAHNLNSRKPNLREACSEIAKRAGEEYLEATEKLGSKLLGT